jgi:mRNA-degrading endonuclease RelE of RelBE toxin-antitoxin system
MTWTIHIAKPAQKELARAPAKSQHLLRAALEEMQQNPFTGDIVRLRSERSTWRRRVGAYRIFFDAYPEQQHIDVVDIARRTSTTYK